VLGSAIAAVVMLIGGVLVTARMGLDLRELRSLRIENELLKADNQKIRQLEAEVSQLETFRRRVLAIANEGSEEAGGKRDTRPPSAIIAEEQSTRSGLGAALSDGIKDGETGTGGEGARLLQGLPPPPPRPPNVTPLGWRWPVQGVVSKGFQVSPVPGKEHHGLDIAAAHGTPVLAARGGRVSFAGQDSVFGRLVILDHGGGIESLYGHNSMLRVGTGDTVTPGQEIARVGSTGESSAPHLHFEIRERGVAVDPRKYLP
ncbi:MAG TPA: M23 family metallopeptidase, partial [Candidatus Udaeobacter sp.]|nr:M23 family metallopeptidase [Candidatus Udaeobacter sp.]